MIQRWPKTYLLHQINVEILATKQPYAALSNLATFSGKTGKIETGLVGPYGTTHRSRVVFQSIGTASRTFRVANESIYPHKCLLGRWDLSAGKLG